MGRKRVPTTGKCRNIRFQKWNLLEGENRKQKKKPKHQKNVDLIAQVIICEPSEAGDGSAVSSQLRWHGKPKPCRRIFQNSSTLSSCQSVIASSDDLHVVTGASRISSLAEVHDKTIAEKDRPSVRPAHNEAAKQQGDRLG